MENNRAIKPAAQPEELNRFFEERLNAGDVEGLVTLYESEATLSSVTGEVVSGTEAIRRQLEQLIARKPRIKGTPRAALRCGELALTSTKFSGQSTDSEGQRVEINGTTAEVARRQPDGTWQWVIDEPNILRS
ncbi:MAG: YybH family protein [Candidatus Dormibacteraceae bacterium]